MSRASRRAGSGLLVFALGSALLVTAPARSDDNAKAAAHPLVGTWKMVERRANDDQDYQKPPEGFEQFKFVADSRFVWHVVQDGKMVAGAGGRYKADKEGYTETIDYTLGEGQEPLRGKEFQFTWKLQGNVWHHVGVLKFDTGDVKIDEKWERCK